MYGICCLLLTFTSCQKDNVLTEGIGESTSTERICGTAEFMEKQLQDPEFRKAYEARMIEIEKASTNQRVICNTPKIVPVAVHYQGINNPDAACLIALAQNQINILNADYQGSNSDISTWINEASSTFPGVQYAEMCLQFVLADQNHPAGFGLSDGDLAVTINQTSGDRDNAWSGYINIFVRNIGGGTLGYSQLPGNGNGDGMVINRTAFGSGTGCGVVAPGAPYNLGRTLTHEMGHYLNLRHIWGDGGCGASDFVQDTPDANASNGGCPNIGKTSCGSADLHMNYMDYTYDACMYMFTEGQAVRAENLLNGNLQNVLAKASIVVSSSPEPTCDDGIKNGGETGIDCGGPCAPCGQTCDNGLKDGDETGVDCGGSCPNACPSNGGNTCPITGKYAKFAINNADQVREIATIISNSNDPEVKALVRKMVKHQDELLVVVDKMNNDANARTIMNSLIADYKAADKNDLKVSDQTSAQLIQYLNIAKKYTNANSELNTVIDEAINIVQ